YLSPRQGPCKEHGTRKRLRSMATRKRPGTRKGCHYSTTERLRRCVYSSDRACPCHAYDTTLGWPLPVYSSDRACPCHAYDTLLRSAFAGACIVVTGLAPVMPTIRRWDGLC